MKTTFIATGDSFTTRRISQNLSGYQELHDLLTAHDVRFNNLEMTYHNEEGPPSAFSGGTWAMADPAILDDLKALGLNLYNTANNHSMDYCHGGLMATARNLRQRGMTFAGTGETLAAASGAAYLETGGLRVALIGITSDFHDSDLAGEQGPVLPGRPGVNGLRVERVIHVTEDYFSKLQALVRETNLNAYEEYGARLGYVTPPAGDVLSMNGLRFARAERVWIEERPDRRDLERTVAEIQEARRQADYVMVSVHTHAGDYADYGAPPKFMESFARRCIDAGADVILGHGPHELRGIEIYRGKPIFYSLGNFIFQTETVAKQPAEAYLGKGFPPDTGVGAYMDERSRNGTRGYGTLPPIWFSVLPSWEVEDGVVRELRLYPISLGMELPRSRKGTPRLVKDHSILEHLRLLSGPYGTKICIKDGAGTIALAGS